MVYAASTRFVDTFMNQNEQTISKLLLTALALALILSTISLITAILQLTQLRKGGEMERHSSERILPPEQPVGTEVRRVVPIPDTLTLKADRAASIPSSSSPLRGPELDVGFRIWVTGRVDYNTAIHFTLPSGLQARRIQKAVLKLCYVGSWGTNDKRPVTAHRLTEKWSVFATPFTVGRESAFSTNVVGGPIAGWCEWDATAVVQYWIAHPDENFGILLDYDSTSSAMSSLRFASTRFEDATLYPVLEIISSSSAR